MLDPLLRYALAAAIAATAGRGLVRRGQHAALFPAPAGLLDAALDHGDSKFGRTSRTEVLGSLAARIDEANVEMLSSESYSPPPDADNAWLQIFNQRGADGRR